MTISAAARRKSTPEQYLKWQEKSRRKAEERRQAAPPKPERTGAAYRAIGHSVMERRRLARLEHGKQFIPPEIIKTLANMKLPPSIDAYNEALGKLLKGRRWKRKTISK